MDSRDAAEQWAPAPESFAPPRPVAVRPMPSSAAAALVRAGAASTLHRIRAGEGALLAVNFSLIVHAAPSLARGVALALLSLLTLGAMYAFNDLWDAPTDSNNPKKDRTVVAAYLRHRALGGVAVVAVKAATALLALALFGSTVALAVAGVLVTNVAYSTLLKGVPVVDVAVCGVWGALYAAIVTADPALLAVVGLMTAVCHLYQTLDDRVPDAANGITTTAVRSGTLSRNVLFALSVLLGVVFRAPLGDAAALTAFVPLALFFVVDDPRTGWLLTKVYFGVVWLYLLGIARAGG